MGNFNQDVLNGLPDAFTMEELAASIGRAEKSLPELERETAKNTARETLMLARSNYEVQFNPGSGLSERVLFPVTLRKVTGIEDARFVHFRNEDGTGIYYATYTAYDGKMILPQFLETSDFLRFKFKHVEWPGGGEQRYGALPAKNQRLLCDARPSGRGEYLLDVLRSSPFLAYHAAHS